MREAVHPLAFSFGVVNNSFIVMAHAAYWVLCRMPVAMQLRIGLLDESDSFIARICLVNTDYTLDKICVRHLRCFCQSFGRDTLACRWHDGVFAKLFPCLACPEISRRAPFRLANSRVGRSNLAERKKHRFPSRNRRQPLKLFSEQSIMNATLAIISDLHLGQGDAFDIFGGNAKSRLLSTFLAWLAGRPNPVELVLNGDVVDFLQLKPWDRFDRATAAIKMRTIAEQQSSVFQALGSFLRDARHQLKVLLGNHDIELAYPEVGRVFREAVLANTPPDSADRMVLLDRRTEYNPSINGFVVHIEHGNATDPWNDITYQVLFQDAERGTDSYKHPTGTQFVYDLMNQFKEEFQFVDLLKPEMPAVAALLIALRPWQSLNLFPQGVAVGARTLGQIVWRAIVRVRDGVPLAAAADSEGLGQRPPDEAIATELARALLTDRAAAAVANDLEVFLGDEALEQTHGSTLAWRPDLPARLAKYALQCLHRFGAIELNKPKASFAAPRTDPFAQAARKLLAGDVRIVVFGHTHDAVWHQDANGLYVNSGTWADLLGLPARSDSATLEAWLGGILDNTFERIALPTYVLVEPTSSGVKTSLNLWTETGGQELWAQTMSR